MEITKLHIVLIGLMGSGKSSVGRQLATLTDLSYFDTDWMVEAQMRKPITEIFRQFGEARFRELEHEMICKAVSETKPAVIATGGGAVMNSANREQLWQRGLVVYLQADVELLFERTARDQHRPLLHTADPQARIAELLQARAPFYEQADLVVPIRHKNTAQICEEILRHWPAERGPDY
ncbi:MAG: shikimate kinase [Verrucomicrobiales bacterium]|jgi:shikimate kinase|nr:shikimate kinase [Verrucomicrobiales bacterium]